MDSTSTSNGRSGAANTFSWSNGATGNSYFSLTPICKYNLYTVYGELTSSGCKTVTKTIALLVKQTPTVSINTTSQLICAGTSLTLNVNGANSFTWDSGVNYPNLIISPTVATTYSVKGNFLNGCVSSASILINVSPLPQVNILVARYRPLQGRSQLP